VLADIWSRVVGLERVGIHDNFFEIGGHSLLATRIISQVRDEFQMELPLRALFESPTVAGLAERLNREGIDRPERVAVRSAPLSQAQRRLWFLEQLEPAAAAYRLTCTLRLRGVLQVEALEEALRETVRRHELLRTTFVMKDEQPLQLIHDEWETRLAFIDLGQRAAAEREVEARRVVASEWDQAFELASGPLLRAVLLKLNEKEHWLVLSLHQIIADRDSLGVLVAELGQGYEALVRGEGGRVAELGMQYADWVRRQEEPERGANLKYWKERLSDAPPLLELVTDRPRLELRSYEGESASRKFKVGLCKKLNELSERVGVKLQTTLLAGWQILLSRYSDSEDIVVGIPQSGRAVPGTERLIGPLSNTLVLRTDLGGEQSFVQLLERVREVVREAEGAPVQFEGLVEELQPLRNLSYAPVVQVMFGKGEGEPEEPEWGGVSFERMALESKSTSLDLQLEIAEVEGELLATLGYNSDVFEAQTIRTMLEHYEKLLEEVVAHPDGRISELTLLTTRERQQVVGEWGQGEAAAVIWQTVPQMFEEQVEHSGENTALVFEGSELSYEELNSRANQLAHYLRAQGVGPEVPVGILLERSVEMVVALLAVLKAGGAYLPLDPDYPVDRLSWMLENSQAPLLLTQQHLTGKLPENIARVVCLDSGSEAFAHGSTENPVNETTPDNLAYIIYTSGSTGRPKGVMISHKGICNRLLWMQETYRLTEADVVLQKTPFSFDVSVWEFFWPLLNGASLLLARPGGHRDPAYLIRLIEEQQVTTLHFVPSMLQVFLNEEALDRCYSLQRVICSGEALSLELQQRFFAHSNAELHNLYGPTEASVDVANWACQRSGERRTVPIGRPIFNTQIYLLDRHLNSVSPRLPGELHIGGVGLARGYAHQPALTAEKFIPDLFSNEPGARLYKTGDLAYYAPDGNIEFLGRIDDQLKIRGNRIEPGEIKATLTAHPMVREAVVVVREDVPGDKRLIAYVVAAEEPATSNEFRTYLKEKLPDYMVPSAFVLLKAMPLTTNGKLDRRALPLPNATRSEIPEAFVPPRGPVEEALLEMWRELLRVDRISVHDNFFELGGHSLLLIQIENRIQKVFQVELTLRILFNATTIAEMSKAISAKQVEQEDPTEIARMIAELKELSPAELEAYLEAEAI
jgi:amino acid adenylation domain-containing protein